jgi:diguanylate cyclase (GGDEF)-like protein/PAS domain S-box-containing protein
MRKVGDGSQRPRLSVLEGAGSADLPDLPDSTASVDSAGLRAALRAAETSICRLTGIVDAMSDAVFTATSEGIVTSWNRRAEEIYGYPAHEIVGSHIRVLHPSQAADADGVLATALSGKTVRGLETIRRTRSGRLTEVSINASPLTDDQGVCGVVVVSQDISERRELEAELVRVTMHDALTGLPNRSYLTYRLTQALVEARRSGRPVAVLLVDLDQFKTVDDVHGHVVGDRVLAEIAERLRALARPIDIVARVGGDEFVLVCPGLDGALAGELADLIIEAIGAPVEVAARELRVGASVGIAVAPLFEADAETLLKHASTAMYEAKARGRARSQVFDHDHARQAGDEHRLAVDLRHALARDLLEVHYQPVVALGSDRVVGVEALTRWQHPTRGAVPPSMFVPLAETHGIVADLDRWVLEQACLEIATATCTGQLPPGTRVAVNLSARSLDDNRLVETVDGALRRSGLPPESLVLEVTETAVLQNRSAARASLEGLRRLGVGIFLDDFGTGYSSLSFLRELPVTGVKIDQSFVRDALDRPEDLAIIEAVIRLASGLGLETVGEGVETYEQRELLHRLGCASAQGFWWSPAVPLADLPEVARAGRSARTGRSGRLTARVVEPAPIRSTCCLRGGLEAGQGWLVVTDDERRATLARSLGSLYTAAVARGQLVELNAFETIHTVTTPDGRFDTGRFDRVMADALRRLGRVAVEVGIHADLDDAHEYLRGPSLSSDLRRRLRAHPASAVERPVECADHGAPPGRLAVRDFNAS